jgi:SAM-dependent methyltransferase
MMFKTTFMPTPLTAGMSSDPATERARATWTAGNFGHIAPGFATGAAEFIARLHLMPGTRLLDVACGTGNLALPAARLGVLTTGIDIAPNLIAQAVASAYLEALPARFEVGNAEELPYCDASFDVVVSMFGAMFAARPARTASELLRVTKRGGRIALANWTSGGFIGEMLRTVSHYAPPPADSAPVLAWGDEDVVLERLAAACRVDCVRRHIALEYPCSPADTVRIFLHWYGPIVRARATLDGHGRAALERELTELWTDHNRGSSDSTRVESEYLDVRAVR